MCSDGQPARPSRTSSTERSGRTCTSGSTPQSTWRTSSTPPEAGRPRPSRGSADAAQGVVFILIFPLTFLANTFVATGDLPDGLRQFAEWNPISAVTAALRDLFGNPGGPTSDAWPLQHPIEATLIWSVLILALCVPLAVRTYRRSTAR